MSPFSSLWPINDTPLGLWVFPVTLVGGWLLGGVAALSLNAALGALGGLRVEVK